MNQRGSIQNVKIRHVVQAYFFATDYIFRHHSREDLNRTKLDLYYTVQHSTAQYSILLPHVPRFLYRLSANSQLSTNALEMKKMSYLAGTSLDGGRTGDLYRVQS